VGHQVWFCIITGISSLINDVRANFEAKNMRLKTVILPVLAIAYLVASDPFSCTAFANETKTAVKESTTAVDPKVDPLTAGLRKQQESVEEQGSGVAPVLEPFLIMMLGWVLLTVSAGIKLLTSRTRRYDQSVASERNNGLAGEEVSRGRGERDQ
jgi:hypothetical protein